MSVLASPPAAMPLVQGERGVCCGGDPREAQAGVRLLQQGGNAVDAAVGAAFMACVVEQVDCSLGGFVHVSAWLADRGDFLSVDGYVRAPGRAHEQLFEVDPRAEPTYYGHPRTVGDRARYGGLAVAVPGAVAGLCDAHARGGRLPLAQVLEPAIEQARAGVEATWRDVLALAGLQSRLEAHPQARATLLDGGSLPTIVAQGLGTTRRDTTALAKTLEAIASDGPRAFYDGAIARQVAKAVQRAGGVLDEADLHRYRTRVAAEQPVSYRGLDCVTCFDHVAYEALQILAGFDLPAIDPDSAAYRHLMAEALGVSFADGIYHYDDPALGSDAVEQLRALPFASRRRAGLSPERAVSRPIRPAPLECSDADRSSGSWSLRGTTQVVAADRRGNVASIITAVGWNYGSLVYVPSVGIFLNNAMSYFDPRPGRRASIAAGKTPMFGAPALVATRANAGRIAIAGSGGYRIQTAVLHTLSGIADHGRCPTGAIEHPRVHCQGGPTYVDGRIPLAVQTELSRMGHDVVPVTEDPGTWHFGRVCAVEITLQGIRGSSGPVWATAAAAC